MFSARPRRAARRTAVPRQAPTAGDAGHRLRAPGALHAFNRFELKYLVPRTQLEAIREELTERMDPDPFAGSDGYGVWSVYYDTAQLRFYREKIEGLKFRRKLRIRRYGENTGEIDAGAPVSVEIKQRVNRVTQKRRVMLPYEQALDLCDRREHLELPGGDQAFVDEVLDLVVRLDLRATAMTGYRREPFVGVGADLGLRVTLDHRVLGRDRDFDLRAKAENRFIIRPDLAVLEVKVDERAPYWVTDMAARHGLQIQRISKYCQSVEAHGLAPRSVFHVPDDGHVDLSERLDAPTEHART
ncbi:polyphosphate polymerase domain-containing protein [Brachybacterium sp. GU-2]|uniref:polyphosphate polymerase domain-containing protein n=1 Tax=Brachybacterium sp. GU-2 TaxID=3069708 RepID=UPI00280B5F91|nr:polyphosphate polymerase domain-containing protein [Brachybacterium sp. GU-2]WME21608.1 polyphosphate polymerase domain-containing protein [Brachybacterium sp. GU-2]